MLFAPNVLGQRVHLGIRRAYDCYRALRSGKTDTKRRWGRSSEKKERRRTVTTGVLCPLRSLAHDMIDDGEEREGMTVGEAATTTV